MKVTSFAVEPAEAKLAPSVKLESTDCRNGLRKDFPSPCARKSMRSRPSLYRLTGLWKKVSPYGNASASVMNGNATWMPPVSDVESPKLKIAGNSHSEVTRGRTMRSCKARHLARDNGVWSKAWFIVSLFRDQSGNWNFVSFDFSASQKSKNRGTSSSLQQTFRAFAVILPPSTRTHRILIGCSLK